MTSWSEFFRVQIFFRCSKTGKITAIRRIAVRDTGVSWQPYVPDCGHPLKSLGPSKNNRIGGFKGDTIWAPIMTRDASVGILSSLLRPWIMDIILQFWKHYYPIISHHPIGHHSSPEFFFLFNEKKIKFHT